MEDNEWGLRSRQCMGVLKLLKCRNGTLQHPKIEIESAAFDNRQQRQKMMEMWNRKYQINQYPHLYEYSVMLNDIE